MLATQNPYALSTTEENEQTHYYVSFNDGQGKLHKIEVSQKVYVAFYECGKQERNLKRWDERHIEYSELTDENLHGRALHQPKDLDEVVFEKLRSEKLAQATSIILSSTV